LDVIKLDNVIIERLSESPFYSVEVRSDIGSREQQQDHAYLQLSENRVYVVVCDGMGGAADGGIASREAILAMEKAYKDCLIEKEKDTAGFLFHAMNDADRAVYNKTRGLGGTTLVAVCICSMKMYWISAGDSRLYIVRAGEMIQATRDHNYRLRLDEMLKSKEIGPAVYAKEMEQGNALLSYLGKGGIELYDLTQEPFLLQRGDVILAATDGVFNAIPAKLLHMVLSVKGSTAQKADTIIRLIQEKGKNQAQDNSTFALIEILK